MFSTLNKTVFSQLMINYIYQKYTFFFSKLAMCISILPSGFIDFNNLLGKAHEWYSLFKISVYHLYFWKVTDLGIEL